MSISIRLREERNRLHLTQSEAAAAGGVGFTSYQGYERGDRAPNADSLVGWASAGFDVGYIITGRRSGEELADDQNALLSLYGQMDEKAKKLAVAVLQTIATNA